MKWLILFIFLIPCSFAYDCSQFSGLSYNNCVALSNVSAAFVSNLVYTASFIPNHDFIANYNAQISVSNPPENVSLLTGNYIRNAWISIVTVEPSVVVNDTLFVNNVFAVRSEYNYQIQIPTQYNNNFKKAGRTCKETYSLLSQSAHISTAADSVSTNDSNIAYFVISQPTTIVANVTITATVQYDVYAWKYLNNNWQCVYSTTGYSTDVQTPTDSIQVSPWTPILATTAQIGEPYLGTQKVLVNDSVRNYILTTDNASLSRQSIYFSTQFTKPPYNFIQLYAENTNQTSSDDVIADQNDLIIPNTNNCEITSYDLFQTDTENCSKENITVDKFSTDPIPQTSWQPLIALIVIAFVCIGMYRIVKAKWGKYALVLFITAFLMPSAFASDCGLTNLGSCIPDSIFNYISGLVNAPLEPLLAAINYFLTQPVSIDVFYNLWLIVVYIISFFYIIMLAFAGFKFMTSGHDVLKREQAKEWLQNAILATVFTSASFYLYQLLTQVSATVTQGLMAMVPVTFFQITADTVTNVSLEFFFITIYLIVLLMTILIFSLRYIFVVVGVLFIPFGTFCYYVPPLKSYGNLILQIIGILNAVPIFCGLIALACSQMTSIDFFANTRILLMISAFLVMDTVVIVTLWHIVNASGIKGIADKTISAGKYIAAMVA